MINVSAAFKNGMIAQARKVELKAIVDITPVGITYGAVTGSTPSGLSNGAQVYDEITEISQHAITSEMNRWIIGQPFKTSDRYGSDIEVGYETNGYFDNTGSGNYYFEVAFSNVSVLQAISLYFPNNQVDGYPVDFDVQVKIQNEVAETIQVRNNRQHDERLVSGFTVNWPSSIRIIITKWSIPNRRLRMPEIRLGIKDEWTDSMFASFSLQRKSSFTAFSLPYATCTLAIDNSEKRFDPTNKGSLFLSLEERQPIIFYMRVNESEYETIGTFYHFSGGWKTGNSELSLQWNLVDLIGLIVDRAFDTSGNAALPNTFEGWVRAILAQLGPQFEELYAIESPYDIVTLEATKAEIEGHTCGEILQWACQATATWPRSISDGRLYIGRFERSGQSQADTNTKLSYDNLEKYPILKANQDIARFDYKVGEQTYTRLGTSLSSPNTQTIDNPFIKHLSNPQIAIDRSANYSIQFYGGNAVETVGRGNPEQEVGDIVFVELDKGTYIPARIIEQSIEIKDRVLKSCKTILQCLNDIADYNTFVILTTNQTWRVPGNLKITGGSGKIRVVLVQAGSTGGNGTPAINDPDMQSGTPGEDGIGGLGGKVNIVKVNGQDISVSRGQNIIITVGRASEPARTFREIDRQAIAGGHSTITINGNTYSSASGTQPSSTGITETITAKTLSRADQLFPAAYSGDGGVGGSGGQPETIDYEEISPTRGHKGADGCVIICYNVEEE